MAEFKAHSHGAVAVIHEKWFDRTPYSSGAARMVFPDRVSGIDVWCYPEAACEVAPTSAPLYRWLLPRQSIRQPEAFGFLNLMWRAEMANEAARHRIATGSRANISSIAEQMAYLMTGREIAKAVCRQLRLRPFPEADPPIAEASLVQGAAA